MNTKIHCIYGGLDNEDYEIFIKKFCILIGKTYTEYIDNPTGILKIPMKILVLVQDIDKANIIDKALWTFSKSLFIPHGTINDDYLDEHPILISDKIIHDSKIKSLILFDLNSNKIIDLLNDSKDLSIDKIILLYPNNLMMNDKKIVEIFSKSHLYNIDIKFQY